MMLCGDGQLIRSHFVRSVAVGDDPVCSDNNSCRRVVVLETHFNKKRKCDPTHSVTRDSLFPHGERRHAVCDEGGRETLGDGLVRRQSGPLVVGPRLRAVQTLQAAERVQRPYHS